LQAWRRRADWGAPTCRSRSSSRSPSPYRGHPEIFVLGDVAAARGRDGHPLPGLAAAALQQGQQTARNIERRLRGEALVPFRYRNYGNMATIGRNVAVAELGSVRFDGRLAWFMWLFVHLIKIVGLRNRAAVLLQWFWAYVTMQRSVRLIKDDDKVWGTEQDQGAARQAS